MPPELLGTWQSIDGGDALDVIEFQDSGRFTRGQVLTQARPSGLFEFSIASTGTVQVDGDRLVLLPEERIGKMKDPDAANGGWERPLELGQEPLGWAVTGSGSGRELRLASQEYGESVYRLV